MAVVRGVQGGVGLQDGLQQDTLDGYKEVGSHSQLKETFEAYLQEHNKQMKPMQLVFFDDALDHLMRLLRVLRVPQVFMSHFVELGRLL